MLEPAGAGCAAPPLGEPATATMAALRRQASAAKVLPSIAWDAEAVCGARAHRVAHWCQATCCTADPCSMLQGQFIQPGFLHGMSHLGIGLQAFQQRPQRAAGQQACRQPRCCQRCPQCGKSCGGPAGILHAQEACTQSATPCHGWQLLGTEEGARCRCSTVMQTVPALPQWAGRPAAAAGLPVPPPASSAPAARAAPAGGQVMRGIC